MVHLSAAIETRLQKAHHALSVRSALKGGSAEQDPYVCSGPGSWSASPYSKSACIVTVGLVWRVAGPLFFQNTPFGIAVGESLSPTLLCMYSFDWAVKKLSLTF